MTNQVFILPKQPSDADLRPRNAFGFCTEFGETYSEYYDMKDKVKNEGFSPRLRQAIAEAHPREIRELATYINTYLSEQIEEVDFPHTIKDAIEAFGGGAEQ